MRIRADEHVSPEIVRAVKTLAHPSFELDSIYDAGHRGDNDVPWITKFARDGGKIILSADADFHKKPHQIAAVGDLGLIVIHLPSRWANAKCRLQAAHILYWWDCIEQTLRSSKPRDFWRVPWGFPENLSLSPLKVNYDAARRKVRKANRPSRSG